MEVLRAYVPRLTTGNHSMDLPASFALLAVFFLFFAVVALTAAKVSAFLLPSYRKISQKEGFKAAEWDSYVLTLAHSPLSAVLAVLAVLDIEERCDGEPHICTFTGVSDIGAVATLWTLAFAIVDFGCLLLHPADFGKMWKPLLVHHLILVAGYVVGLGSVPAVAVYTMVRSQTVEVTNPFMAVRYFLSALGLKSTNVYKINAVVFTLLFIILRVGYIGHTVYIFLQPPEAIRWHPAIIFNQCMMLGIYTLQLMWLKALLVGLRGIMKGKKGA